jgi:hypothetical protein
MEVVDLVHAGDRILVFTPSACYALGGTEENPSLESVDLLLGVQKAILPSFRFLDLVFG